MRSLTKEVAVVLLLINGIGALFGGLNLILAPDGSRMHMPVNMLQYSPFHNFLIPGIVLLVTNGIGSLLALTMMTVNYPKYPLLVMTEGAVLTGWIVIQVLLLRAFVLLHAIFLFAGILLIMSGWLLQKTTKQA